MTRVLAYTKYGFCEWFLIFTDVWFDSVTTSDFSVLEVRFGIPNRSLTVLTWSFPLDISDPYLYRYRFVKKVRKKAVTTLRPLLPSIARN